MTKRMALLDWRAIKYYHARLWLIPLPVLAAGWVTPLYAVPVSMFLWLFFSINVFAVEEKGDLNRLYLTMPVTRCAVVAGRCAFSLCMGAAGLLTGIPLALLADRFTVSHYYGPPAWFLPVAAVSCLLFSVFHLCMFPLLFKLGYSKGKLWGMLLPVICFFVLYAAWVTLSFWPGNEEMIFHALQYAREHMLPVNGGIFAASALLLLCSFWLSKRIYEKREF